MSLNIYLEEKNKLKRVLVLVGVMAISLFACGGGKEIEMNGSEEKKYIYFTMKKFRDVKLGGIQ